MADFYQLDPGLQQKPLIEKLNFILRQIFKRLDSTDSTKGPVKFYNNIDMLGNAIVDGPKKQDNIPDTDFITAGYLKTKAAAQAVQSSGVITGGGAPPPPSVPPTRLINTTAPLTGGGDLSADRTLGITQATATTDGYLSAADWTTFFGRMSNPMNALGDIIYGGAAGTPTRLGIGVSGTVLHGGATPTWSAVVETDILLAVGSTVNNASTTKHGFLPTLSNNAGQFLNGQGNWATPAGQANGYTSQGFISQTTVTVTHNFGAYPAVQIIDSGGKIIQAKEVTHTSVNAFTVTFVVSTTGTVIATIGSPQAQAVIVVTNNYLIQVTDRIIECSVAGKTITLPTAVGHTGMELAIDNSAVLGDITLDSAGGTIEGEASQAIPPNSAIHCYSDGTNWRIW